MNSVSKNGVIVTDPRLGATMELTVTQKGTSHEQRIADSLLS